LQALLEDVPSPVLRQVLVDIIDGLTTGTTLSDAIAAHSGLFPRYYVGILRSAELTGNLDVVLDQLAGYIERDLEARRAVKSALTYPLVIMAMSAITVVILVGWVLPKFQAFFAGFKQQLPLPTRLLMGGSRFMTQRGPVILAGAAVLGLLLYLYLRTERGRYSRDRFMLRIPLLGGVVQYAVVERFCRILGSMLHAGVPVPEALAAAGEGANNRVYERALRVARDQVLQGEGLAKPVTATGLFPRAASQMFRVGEASGTLDTQLVMTADFYAGELAHRVKKLTALFEPLVIIVMGGIVGFVAVALVSAMYGIFNSGNIQ
jgi:type IV pilus assembly protein PilC